MMRYAGFMKKLTLATAFASLPALVQAQQPELPQPSPAASVSQTIGLTEVAVKYSSPGAKGRAVWDGLVPYGELWRTGANAATVFSADRDVTVGGQKVKAGRYALYTIPGAQSWTVILNTHADASGTNGYDQSNDAARFEVVPAKAPALERMRFAFTDATADMAMLHLEWAGLRVSIPVEADTSAQIEENIAAAVSGAWRPHAVSARYLLENGGDAKRALELARDSIDISEKWYNRWIEARALHAIGQDRAAKKAMKTALSLGDDSGAFRFYSQQMKAALEDW